MCALQKFMITPRLLVGSLSTEVFLPMSLVCYIYRFNKKSHHFHKVWLLNCLATFSQHGKVQSFVWRHLLPAETDLDLLGKWHEPLEDRNTSISANINDLANQDFQHKLCVLSFNLLPPLAMSSPLFVLILGVHFLQKFHHLRRIWRPCYVHEVLHGHYTWGPQHFGPTEATSQCR